MEERRMFERFKVEFKVKFLNLNTNKEGVGKMVNISAGGGCIVATEKRLQPSMTLKMQFCIADDKDPFYANGKVIWSRMIEPDVYMAGIQFEKVDFMGIARALRIHS
ncbi:MAG: PilZ domain-containing protein [Candidatus Omnitrophota bacterium]|nr:PilZ domain-containing protein [Candidatus Omnitrophota bacterium]